ncbi:MAG: alpha/beta hydrolase [Actinomycetota bacterium]
MSGERWSFEVPVDGGAIAASRWGTGDRVVVASHGITANRLSWQRVAELVVERSDGAVSLVAVDHRGRAGSAATPGPFGLRAHGADLIAVLDHLGLGRAALVGHSMGGFVVAAAAEGHPDRVERLVLVDGGLPFPLDLPADVDVEAAVQSVIGPALDRLDQRWPDLEAYVDFFRAHPAFQPPNRWTSTVEAYVRHDAVQTEDGQIRSSVSKEAVLVDGGAAIVDPASSSAIERIDVACHLLWAPRGILDQSPGLYPADSIEEAVGRLGHLRATLVDDVNHYTIVVDDGGATAVADAILGEGADENR